jgi:hypothetical protein
MEQLAINNDDTNIGEYQLFSDVDFASLLDEIPFSTGMLYHSQLCHTSSTFIDLQVEKNKDLDEMFASLFFDGNAHEHSSITDEYYSSEFQQVLQGELYEYF